MGVNKVIYNAQVLVDLTGDSVDSASLLTGKTAHDKSGAAITGTMRNNGTVTKTLSTSAVSYTIPAGYHSGSGKVSIVTQEKTVTPGSAKKTVTPDTGKVLSKVIVNAVAASEKTIYSGFETVGSNTDSISISTGIQVSDTDSIFIHADANGKHGDIVNSSMELEGYAPQDWIIQGGKIYVSYKDMFGNNGGWYEIPQTAYTLTLSTSGISISLYTMYMEGWVNPDDCQLLSPSGILEWMVIKG